MLRDIDKQIEEGREVSVGALPDLDQGAVYWAQLWGDLRGSTPGDQPISIRSIVDYVGRSEMRYALPILQGMDSVMFRWQRDRAAAERKRAEAKAKAKRKRGR